MDYLLWSLILDYIREADTPEHFVSDYIYDGLDLYWCAPLVYQLLYPTCTPTNPDCSDWICIDVLE